ncbi:MAG: cytochrome C oxidase subunit IV family protein [Deltaproteobacteria bacterium]|nr:cytochrome C oxidase subunit IV family protein [Deltaproteobacteria bacterium]
MKSVEHHSISFYITIWVILMVAIGASVYLGSIQHAHLATLLIFSVATVKAILVANYYMGLSHEPKYITLMLLVGVLFIGLLFVGLIPDIVYIYGK